MTKPRIIILVGIAILLSVIAWQRRWFAGEAAYRGRTVTEWLDRLAIYDKPKVFADRVEHPLRSGEALAADPAAEALLNIGRKGVPTLLKRIADRAEWSPEVSTLTGWRRLIRWKWNGSHGRGGSAPEDLYSWSEAQKARKNAAAFILMALGTNGGAGFAMYLEAYAAAPKHQSVYGTRVAGPPVGPTSSSMARSVAAAFPERREELVGEIMRGLEHSNAWCRVVAMECARVFQEELLQRKELLLKLTRDPDPTVQEATLGGLMLIVQQPSFDRLISPAEVKQAAQAVADDLRNTERVRELAATLVKVAGQRINE